MGFSLIFFGLILFLLLLMIFAHVFSRKREWTMSSPHKMTTIVFSLLLLQWLLFITSAYSLLPMEIADAIFLPVWVVLGTAGILAGLFEFRNHTAAALRVTGLALISLLMAFFVNGVSNM
ncbi:hypothetical protein [Halobacillus massiliensis]|uniref:hypothetical protein n=1 Tax=Halobacillus massiliensis TaxID=1926286 RepID=UPI0009E656A1|nr:hypothetical protein [Halobacillus massiliensis]